MKSSLVVLRNTGTAASGKVIVKKVDQAKMRQAMSIAMKDRRTRKDLEARKSVALAD